MNYTNGAPVFQGQLVTITATGERCYTRVIAAKGTSVTVYQHTWARARVADISELTPYTGTVQRPPVTDPATGEVSATVMEYENGEQTDAWVTIISRGGICPATGRDAIACDTTDHRNCGTQLTLDAS